MTNSYFFGERKKKKKKKKKKNGCKQRNRGWGKKEDKETEITTNPVFSDGLRMISHNLIQRQQPQILQILVRILNESTEFGDTKTNDFSVIRETDNAGVDALVEKGAVDREGALEERKGGKEERRKEERRKEGKKERRKEGKKERRKEGKKERRKGGERGV